MKARDASASKNTVNQKSKSASPQGEDHGNESRGEGGGRECWSWGGLIQNWDSVEIFTKYKFVL